MIRSEKIELIMGLLFSIIFSSCNNHSQNSSGNTITIGFAGDTMLGRGVNEIIKQKGYEYPWGNVLPYLHKTNLNIVNLETTLTRSTKAEPKAFNFKSDPDHVQSLIKAHINIVNLANNHIKDFGNEGLFETIETLDNVGIKHVGAGKDIHAAHKPVIITKNNITIGIIGTTDNEPGWKASQKIAGINHFFAHNTDQLLEDISTLKKQVNLVIVTLHWGPNMRERPSKDFIDAAHAMIDAGADIIHGHSAHIFQGIEIYKEKLIMYDTGDFVDDYMVDPVLRNDRSFLFLIEVDKNGPRHLRLIPTLIKNMQVNVAQGIDRKEPLEQIKKLSHELGTTIDEQTAID